jgi:hypothetical protein
MMLQGFGVRRTAVRREIRNPGAFPGVERLHAFASWAVALRLPTHTPRHNEKRRICPTRQPSTKLSTVKC